MLGEGGDKGLAVMKSPLGLSLEGLLVSLLLKPRIKHRLLTTVGYY
ncbi:hypothetical protein TERTU_2773 [Teredinibacter turnerae T7901]|uniref:Uncharacterized protein n=1 Tax=Teredinibacter turnerae (strain ATCC 39867 / T7901) TaxID=377629 RepID=C5BMM0_TERTT|nr:hypothetical protein TERTU_2773 [Teredinibacter turnerae T7901]